MKRILNYLTVGIISVSLFTACNNNSNNQANNDEHHDHEHMMGHNQHDNTPGKELEVNSENSLYQLTGEWTSSENQKVALSSLQGKMQLVAMIFTHCGHACPMMVENMKAIGNELPKNVQDKFGYLLVTMDDERDTPDVLKKYAQMKELDNKWTLLHGDAEQVRALSMLLNVQYNKLSGGDYNHNNILTILDQNGNIVKQWEGLNLDNKMIAKVVKDISES